MTAWANAKIRYTTNVPGALADFVHAVARLQVRDEEIRLEIMFVEDSLSARARGAGTQ